MYWWADSTYTALREEDDERLCLRIIACVTGEHNKERVAVSNRFRESTDSGLDVLRDLKDRGLSLSPRLAVGDGAPGTFKAPWSRSTRRRAPSAAGFTA